jgi:putative membrane protein
VTAPTVLAGSLGWTFDPLQLGPLLLVGWGYATRARTLARAGRPVSLARQGAFYAGLVAVFLALASPVHALGEQRLFWAHMAQHLLLGDIGPLLVVLGLTGPLLRPMLALPVVRRLRFLGHPLVALPLWAVNLYAWHVPVLYEAALAHGAVHALEHELFFATGALMWAAVIEPLPGPAWFGTGWKAAYVLAVRTVGAGLAMVFIWSGHPLYDWYHTPLSDQVIGGAIMFTEGSIVTLLAFAWLFLAWMDEGEPTRAPRVPPPPPPPGPPRSPRPSGARGRPA